MSAPVACFENIIGLSRTDCECVEDRPVDAGVSASDLYLDELPGLNLLMANAARKCGQGTLWDMLSRARANAIEETKAELGSCVEANTDPRRETGISHIGSDKKASATGHALSQPFHGLTVQTDRIRGGTFEVQAMATAFKPDSLPATIEVKVYERESLSSDAMATYTLPCTGNKVVWTELPTPLVLDMASFGSADPRYWFLYQPALGMRAMNTLVNCDCGGYAPYWHLENPQYRSSNRTGKHTWANWSMAVGTSGATLFERDDWRVTNETMGIMLRVKFECDAQSTFCTGAPNYSGDMIQKVIAHAVRFKAGASLITDLLSSTDISPYTMTGGEQLQGNRRSYESQFNKRITEFLCPELSSPENVNRYGDCRKCRDRWGMRRSTIPN